MQTEARQQSDRALDKTPADGRATLPCRPWLLFAACFAITLVVALRQNLTRRALEYAFAFDAGHYICTAVDVLRWWHHALGHGVAFSAQQVSALSTDLLLDGPILPFLGAALLMPGSSPHMVADTFLLAKAHGYVLIAANCGMLASSSVLVMWLTRRVTGSWWYGLAGGLAWGLYPASILAARLFMTEPLAALLLLGAVTLIDWTARQSATSRAMPGIAPTAGGIHGGENPSRRGGRVYGLAGTFLLGVTLGGLILLKVALLPLVGLLLVLAGISFGKETRWVQLGSLGAGIVAAFIPWLVLSAQLTGQIHWLPERAPVKNIACGLDLSVDGWGCVPNGPAEEEFAQQTSGVAVATTMVARAPIASAALTLRKLGRLFDKPWNDFNQSALALPFAWQMYWHRLAVILGAIGLLMYFAQKVPIRNRHSRFIAWATLAVVAGHLIFLPFSANPRYAYSALPFICLFAIYAVHTAAVHRRLLSLSLTTMVIFATWFFCSTPQVVLPPFAFSSERLCLLTEIVLAGALIFVCSAVAAILLGACGGKPERGLPLTAVPALLLAIAACACLTGPRVREWQCILQPGQTVYRKAYLPEGAQAQPVVLCVDGDENIVAATAYVNGHQLPLSAARSQFAANASASGTLAQVFAFVLGHPAENLRQWRTFAVPPQLLKFGDTNVIAITTAQKPCTVYGDYIWRDSHRQRHLPSAQYFSAMALIDGQWRDPRPPQAIRHPSPPAQPTSYRLDNGGSETRDDLALEPGRQFGEYRLFLAQASTTSDQAFHTDRLW